MRVYFLIFLFFCIFWQLPQTVWSAAFQPGFRTIGSFIQEPQARLDINVWYPSTRAPRSLNYSQWIFNGALNGKAASGKFPLIVLSHPTAGTRFSYHELAANLARSGFVVAAPGHAKDCLENMDDLYTWGQLVHRVEEVRHTLDLVRQDPLLAEIIDWAKIGYAGFGSGATTGLLLGGAKPDCGMWPDYCENSGKNDIYCSNGIKDKMEAMCQEMPGSALLAEPAIQAYALVSPVYGLFFTHNSFAEYQRPTLFVESGKENNQLTESSCKYLTTILGSRARCLELPEADTGAMMSSCPEFLRLELPDLCLSVEGGVRASIQQKLREALVTFFIGVFKIETPAKSGS